jgi:hypothetical protein
MAAGESTVRGCANAPDTGYVQISGESAASTAVALAIEVGFEPLMVKFWALGAANATIPNISHWLKATGGAICWLITGATGAWTAVTSNEITVTQNATTGVWTVNVPSWRSFARLSNRRGGCGPPANPTRRRA